jgi:hypothetical protein
VDFRVIFQTLIFIGEHNEEDTPASKIQLLCADPAGSLSGMFPWP